MVPISQQDYTEVSRIGEPLGELATVLTSSSGLKQTSKIQTMVLPNFVLDVAQVLMQHIKPFPQGYLLKPASLAVLHYTALC